MPAWVGALAAATAALIVLAGPAAAPPRPQPSQPDVLDIRHATASRVDPAMQIAFSDLELEQFIDEDEVTVGGRSIIELTVFNAGITSLSGIILRNEVPTGFRIEETDPEGTITGNTVTWSLGSLARDEEIIVTVTVRALQVGTYTNLAAARSDSTNELTVNEQLSVIASGLNPVVTTTTTTTTLPPVSGPVQNGELAATGATLNWIFAGALAMVAGGALAMELSARVPAMASLRGPARRRRVNRPVFHPVRSSGTR